MASSPTHAAILTWPEYAERIASGAVVLLPIGAFEQHGRHLPLNTDTVIATAVAERLAGQLEGIVLPAIDYGARSVPRSGGGDSFPATTNLDGSTITQLVADVLREQVRHGARRLVIVLGHGENDPFVLEGVESARRTSRHSQWQALVAGWWHFVTESDLAPFFPDGFPGWDREHAARVETALMLAVAPELVQAVLDGGIDPVEIPQYTVVPHDPTVVPRQGSLADPHGATSAMGHTLLSLIIERFAGAITTSLHGVE
jgi:creatinine amidohydrolase